MMICNVCDVNTKYQATLFKNQFSNLKKVGIYLLRSQYSTLITCGMIMLKVSFEIIIGAELAGAAGARAPPLFDPRPETL